MEIYLALAYKHLLALYDTTVLAALETASQRSSPTPVSSPSSTQTSLPLLK